MTRSYGMEHINFPAQTQDHFISSGKRSERRTLINYLRKIHDTDFGEMEAAEEGWTGEPESLPHFSSCCFFLLVLVL